MLDRMTNAEIIEHILENPEASEVELEMAERLICAVDELEKLSNAIRAVEAKAEQQRMGAVDDDAGSQS